MRTLNPRNLLHLHRHQVSPKAQGNFASLTPLAFCLVLFAFCAMPAAQAQFSSGQNLNYRDFQAKPYYFGITLGFNQSDFRIFHSKNFILNDSFSRAESITGPGFNLGIVSNLKIGEYFDVRFLPTLSFAERNIRYALPGENSVVLTRRIESVFVEMPFHVRYKSAPFHDFRLFVIGGVKYVFDVASDSRTRQAAGLVKIAPTDFQIEYGAGVQFFFPFFIFSPEFKISQGLNNVLIFNDNLQQSTVLEKVMSRTFTLSIHFEG